MDSKAVPTNAVHSLRIVLVVHIMFFIIDGGSFDFVFQMLTFFTSYIDSFLYCLFKQLNADCDSLEHDVVLVVHQIVELICGIIQIVTNDSDCLLVEVFLEAIEPITDFTERTKFGY